jgi:hypothetical protein
VSAVEEPAHSVVVDRDVCGKWMPRAHAPCARKPRHPGKCITAEALAGQATRRPPKTDRRHGVRTRDDPAVRARWNRTHKFVRLGITERQFNEILAAQNHACAMCRRPFADDQRIFADHDHNCCPYQPKRTAKTCGRCIRGLLCFRCNTALGYIEKYGERPEPT